MKTICVFILTVVATKVAGAAFLKELECHDKVVQQGIDTLIVAGEVNSLSGATNVDHFISGFGSKIHAPVWNSIVFFGLK